MIKFVLNTVGAIVVTMALIYFFVFAFEDGHLVVRQRTDAEKTQLLSRFQVAPPTADKGKPPAPQPQPLQIPKNSNPPAASRPPATDPHAPVEKNFDRKGLEKILEEAK